MMKKTQTISIRYIIILFLETGPTAPAVSKKQDECVP